MKLVTATEEEQMFTTKTNAGLEWNEIMNMVSGPLSTPKHGVTKT